jgi:hypothetical protein
MIGALIKAADSFKYDAVRKLVEKYSREIFRERNLLDFCEECELIWQAVLPSSRLENERFHLTHIPLAATTAGPARAIAFS